MSVLSVQSPYPIFTDTDGDPLESGYIWIGVANLDPQVNPLAVFWDAALTMPIVQPIRTLAGYPSQAGAPGRIYTNADHSIRVQNKRGTIVFTAANRIDHFSADLIEYIGPDGLQYTVQDLANKTNALKGSSLIGHVGPDSLGYTVHDISVSSDVTKGDALISVKSPLSSSIARTQHDKNSEGVSVADYGAIGDGVADDTLAIQTAIKSCFDNNITRLEFVSGKTYAIKSTASQNSLVFYGKNLLIEGNGCTIKRYDTTGGYWGDLIDIIGLQNGSTYPIIGLYSGANSSAENITLQNFTLESDITVTGPCNNVGITFAKNILVRNVISKNAPACNFSAVNVSVNLPTTDIKYENCVSSGAIGHGFSSQQWGGGDALSIIYYGCIAINSGGVSAYEADTLGRRIHLWSRQGATNLNTYVKVIASHFDGSAQIMASSYMNCLEFSSCSILGGFTIISTRSSDNRAAFTDCIFGISAPKTGATAENPVYIRESKNISFTNCKFSVSLTGFSSQINTIALYSVENVTFSACAGLNLATYANSDYNQNVIIDKCEIIRNSTQANTDVMLRLTYIYNSIVVNSVFTNVYVYLDRFSESLIHGNVVEMNYDTGYDYFRSGTSVIINSITNNLMRLTAPAVNYRRWIADSVGNYVFGNIIEETGGVRKGDNVRAAAAPVAGYWFVGDRVVASVPTIGQPKGWVCTVDGTPGTWVSEGNL